MTRAVVNSRTHSRTMAAGCPSSSSSKEEGEVDFSSKEGVSNSQEAGGRRSGSISRYRNRPLYSHRCRTTADSLRGIFTRQIQSGAQVKIQERRAR